MVMQSKSMQDLWQDSYLAAGNESYLEDLYDVYLRNPADLSPEWRSYFEQLVQQAPRSMPDVSHQDIRDHFLLLARHSFKNTLAPGCQSQHEQLEERVIELISAYRRVGHLQANIDPLGLWQRTYSPVLELAYYGFTQEDLPKTFNVGSFLGLGSPAGTLLDLHQALQKIYCRTIGFEYMHINRINEVEWLKTRIEQHWSQFKVTPTEKLRILDRLVVADGLEKYLGFKYVGQKRFSLEGGDSLIPLLDTLIQHGAKKQTKEVVIGMAHRGRLNVLVNILGKEPKAIFAAFEGKNIPDKHSGDVKYHLGFSSNVKTPYGLVHVALAFNPSHLEIVSPVAQGSVRARQRRCRDTEQKQVVPIQIHGDAAFSVQGVVMETFSMSQTRWFTVGGSIHIVINNQVGFTTSNLKDARSSLYCTDPAKIVDAPILHVNSEDPEAVYFAALVAIDYRETFKRDIVIDLVCYRRHGHNEADEPSATQPIMYKVIKSLPATYISYAKKLVEEGVITTEKEKQLAEVYRQELDKGDSVVEIVQNETAYQYSAQWQSFLDNVWTIPASTRMPTDKLKALANNLDAIPEDFVIQPQVKKMLEARRKMTAGELPVNWGYAEILAYATLLDAGYPIRLCGQDTGRGTFAHRHAVLYDQNTGESYLPLSHVSAQQAHINVVDSLLSEEAVLAFEYGYASAEPNNLVLWEAQFGDFANGAQVVIDQFISSGEQKWGRLCGLVMLLPHGNEGQGPEHTSARLERYLQLCAQENMQVCVPTTPAQMFHLLRRQMVRPYRKPLIVMTPKSLLRHPLAVSSFSELSDGEFQLVIPEVDKIDPQKVEHVVLCSGKIYYELLEKRRELKLTHIALIRIEQLYPFPEKCYKHVLSAYQQVKDIIWCQEESQNQGAWSAMQPYLLSFLGKQQTLRYVGREATASPAVGYHAVHEKEQHEVVAKALMISGTPDK